MDTPDLIANYLAVWEPIDVILVGLCFVLLLLLWRARQVLRHDVHRMIEARALALEATIEERWQAGMRRTLEAADELGEANTRLQAILQEEADAEFPRGRKPERAAEDDSER
jgi:exonuclease VII small subunit